MFDISGVSQAAAECGNEMGKCARRSAAEKPDDRHHWLLRTRRERPCRRRAAQQRDELAPPDHSITLSASDRNDSGIVSPSALAVFRLTTSSNLVGCSTGRSEGFAPRRILSTKAAARRKISSRLAA